MTEKLKEVLGQNLAEIDPTGPQYRNMELCFRALTAVGIPPETDKMMAEVGQEANLLLLLLSYWGEKSGHRFCGNVPAVALQFTQDFYIDRRTMQLADRAAEEYAAFLEGLKARDFDGIINAAHEIDVKCQIQAFLNSRDVNDKLDTQNLDILLTVEHPVQRLYEAHQRACFYSHDQLLTCIDMVVRPHEDLLKTEAMVKNEDAAIYRTRYLSGREVEPFPQKAALDRQLMARVEAEFRTWAPALSKVWGDRLRDAMAALQEGGYSPLAVAALLTYDRPLMEVVKRMEQAKVSAEKAIDRITQDRQMVMRDYSRQLDRLLKDLQEKVRTYMENNNALEIFSPHPVEEQQQEPWQEQGDEDQEER